MRRLVPVWARTYRRAYLVPDVIAGLVVWSVVVPQAVAYAQIAGLPPQAGLIAAPGALLAYAVLGTSRTLVVSATTATSALSASAVGPLAGGDATRFAELAAALAVVTAVVLALAGVLRLGSLTDFVSKPVMTGFLFGLGITIAVGQLSKLLGIDDLDGTFVEQVGDLTGQLGDLDATTTAVGAASVVLLVVLRRVAPSVPGTLVVLALAIAVSELLDLRGHDVAVVGELPDALPDPAIPDVSLSDLGELMRAGARRDGPHGGGGRRLPCAGLAGRLHGRREPRADGAWARRTWWPASRAGSCSPAARARPRRPSARAARRSSPSSCAPS